MGSLNITVTVALAILLVAATTASASKADVNIFNEVGQPILLHCQFSHTDLGEHQLLPGANYCWGSHIPIFDVWKDAGVLGQRYQACVHCEWYVRPDGFFGNEGGQALVKVQDW